jgi:hypothetical protein
MDFFQQMMAGIERGILAISVYFGDLVVKSIEGWDERGKRFWRWYDSIGEADSEANSLLTIATEGVTTTRTRLHEEIKEELRDAAAKGGFYGYLTWLIIFVSIQTGKIKAFMSGIQALRAQSVNEDLKPSLAPIEALLRAEMLNPNSTNFLDPIIAKWGLPQSSLDSYRAAMQQVPSLTELLVLRNRGAINNSQALDYMNQQGMNDEDASKVLELRLFYPGPADLVSLAGREAFEEDQIRDFELDKDFDKIPREVFDRAGVTPEVARWYWIAHWQNPSIQQFFEMVHRKAERKPGVPWTLDDVEIFARLSDINPTFVKGLTDIAYRPLTRVDVRRMYQDGILDYNGILKSYTDLGYNPADAKLMSDWTVKYTQRGERSLTKAQLESMFELRQLTRIQLASQLKLIGYPEDQASILSWLASAKREDERVRSFIRRGEFEYKRGLSSQEAVSSFLIDEDIEPDQIRELFDEWDNEKVYEQAFPSKEDVLSWFDSGRIDEEQLRGFLRALRFTDANIDLYVQTDGARFSKTDVLRLYDEQEVTEEKALSDLRAIGYSAEDAMALLGPVTRRIERRIELEQAENERVRNPQNGR